MKDSTQTKFNLVKSCVTHLLRKNKHIAGKTGLNLNLKVLMDKSWDILAFIIVFLDVT